MLLFADTIGIRKVNTADRASHAYHSSQAFFVKVELFKGEAGFRPREPDKLCSDWYGVELLRLDQGSVLVTAAAVPLAPCHIMGGQLLLAHETTSLLIEVVGAFYRALIAWTTQPSKPTSRGSTSS